MRRSLLLLAALVVGAPTVTGADPVSAGSADRPDVSIRQPNQPAFSGAGIHNATGAGQARTVELPRRAQASFIVRITNNGDQASSWRIVGTPESRDFAVRYFLGDQQVSPSVKRGALVVRSVPAGGHRHLRVQVEALGQARLGASHTIYLRAVSVADATLGDTARITARVPVFSASQRGAARLVNTTRSGHGRRPLALNRTLAGKAQRWAQHLAATGRLAHSDLAAGVPSGWRALGENVGYGRTVSEVHRRFLASSGHRRNVLGQWNQIGTGVASRGGRLYVVHVFMRT